MLTYGVVFIYRERNQSSFGYDWIVFSALAVVVRPELGKILLQHLIRDEMLLLLLVLDKKSQRNSVPDKKSRYILCMR